MATFHNTRFPLQISFGAVGGPEFFTMVSTSGGGHEQRDVKWTNARRKWDVAHGLKDQEDLDELMAFFLARQGKGYPYRFRDWIDFCSDMTNLIGADAGYGSPEDPDTLPPIGVLTPVTVLDVDGDVPDGIEVDFQLRKTYDGGGGITVSRDVTHPVSDVDGVRIFIDAVEQDNPTDYSYDDETGIVTFTSAPGVGEVVTADFFFDVPVRFDVDAMPVSITHFDTHDWDAIDVIELRPESL
jgi:hypothetical protein